MSEKPRIVHLIAFLAIIVNILSPVLTSPVIAQVNLPSPDITATSIDASSTPAGEESGEALDTSITEESSSPGDAPILNKPAAEPDFKEPIHEDDASEFDLDTGLGEKNAPDSTTPDTDPGMDGMNTLSADMTTLTIDVSTSLAAGETARPGQVVEVYFTVTNIGSAPVLDYEFDIEFIHGSLSGFIPFYYPAFTACTSVGLPNDALRCYLQASGTLRPNDSHSFYILGTANPACGYGIVMRTVPSWTDSIDTHIPVDIDCGALSLSKFDNVDTSVRISEEFEYHITVTNNGSDSVGGYSFTDPLPPGIELVGVDAIAAPDGVTCIPTTIDGITTIDCESETSPDIDGGSHTITFKVRSNYQIDADVCGDITNTVTGEAGPWTEGANVASVVTNIDCESVAGGDLIKTVDKETVVRSGELTYQIHAVNGSDFDQRMGFVDTLPDGVSFDGASVKLYWLANPDNLGYAYSLNCSDVDGKILTCENPAGSKLNSGYAYLVTINVTVDEDATCGSVLENPVTGFHFLAGRSDSATTFVECPPELALGISANTSDVEPGGNIHYTLTVGNSSSATAPVNATDVSAQLPAGFIFDAELSDDRCTLNEGEIQCEISSSIAPGASEDLLIVAAVSTALSTEMCSEAIVTAQITGYTSDFEMIGDLPSDSIDTTIDCRPDVEISKVGQVDTGDDDRIDEGDLITYTFDLTNTGNIELYDIIVTDSLPGLVWQSGTFIDALAPGASETLTATYAVTQADIDTGEVVNTAEVSASAIAENEPTADFAAQQEGENPTPVIVSASVTEVTELEREPSVLLVKSSEGDDFVVGDTITYTFTITNTGNVSLADLEIVDEMEGVEFADGHIFDTLAPNEIAELTATYIVTQSDLDAGIIVNCADVSTIAPNESAVSDDDCVTDLIDQHRSLQIVYVCQGPTDDFLPVVGDKVTFELTISNNGDQTVHDVVMETSREGDLDTELPDMLAPGESAVLMWTSDVTEDDVDEREVSVDVTVIGETGAGFEATLASAVALQQDNSVSTTITMNCPMADVPVDPATPEPQPITKLPETGHGVGTIAPVLLAAAMVSIAALGIGGIGVRRIRS